MQSPLVLLLPVLLLAACATPAPSGTEPPAAALSVVVADGDVRLDTTNGKYVLNSGAWTGGAGTVGLIPLGPNKVELASEPLAADGAFSLALPTPPQSRLGTINPFPLSPGCTGEIVVSDLAARGMRPLVLVRASKSAGIVQTELGADSILRTVLLDYVDRAGTLKGIQICASAGQTSTIDVDVRVSRGWNMSVQTTQVSVTPGQATITVTIRSGNLGAATWYLQGSSEVPVPNNLKRPAASFFRSIP